MERTAISEGIFDAGATAGTATLPAEERLPTDSTPSELGLWAVVLAGGIGSRFWPLSSPERPKQLLALVGDRPLIAETIGRLQPLIPPDRVLVLTSQDIAPAIRAAIPDVPVENMVIEHRPGGTAMALALAAREIERRVGPETLFCSVHADLAVAFPDAFRHVIRDASRVAASHDVLVAVGVPPSRPETQFGYIVPGAPLAPDYPLAEGGACAAAMYVEKPDAAQVESLLASGALWSSGLFVWRTRVVLDALSRHAGDALAARSAVPNESAPTLRPVSMERDVLAKADNLVVFPGEFGWDDVGTWASLRRARELDDSGNGAFGSAHFVDSSGNVVHAEAGSTVLFGVTGMLVVSLNGLTFVTTLEKAADLQPLLKSLPEHLRSGGRTRDSQPPSSS